MKLPNTESDLFLPSGESPQTVIPRTTHLAIGAHQDDIEIFAYHGILQCFQRNDRQFSAVIATDGAGSPRSGPYAEMSDDQMKAIRIEEQRRAAIIGDFGFVAQLGYPSSVIKDPAALSPVDDLAGMIRASGAEVLYLHNPFDKHDTHIAVLKRCLDAVRRLTGPERPKRVLGCEVWGGLDWLPDELKVPLDVDGQPQVSAALLEVFDSQISGGKRYDLAAEGRRLANATFFQSHSVDQIQRVTFAVDLTELFREDSGSMEDFASCILDEYREDVLQRIGQFEVD